jgi:hypothetical protein
MCELRFETYQICEQDHQNMRSSETLRHLKCSKSSIKKSLSDYLSPNLKPIVCDKCGNLTSKGNAVYLTNLPKYLFTMVEKPFKKFNVESLLDLKKCLSESVKKISSKRESIYALVAVVARKNSVKPLFNGDDFGKEQETDDDFFTVVRTHYNPFTKSYIWKKYSPNNVSDYDIEDIRNLKMIELVIY